MELEGKVALITGGGSGIGAAACRLFGHEGAKVATLSRTLSEVKETAEAVRASGSDALALEADVSKPEDVERAISAVKDRWGRLDIVFAHAGVNGLWAPVEEIPPEAWQQTIAINLHGTFYTIHYAVPLLKQQGGSVIVTSSINGNRKFTCWGASAYSSSKAAQVALVKMTALELAKHQIRVNVICPGAIGTQIEENTEKRHIEKVVEPVVYPAGNIPLTDGKPGTSEQVAQLALFLASDRSSHITGTEIYIDGGESLLEG
ncbi:MAG TPA: SDR family NAD(P)-dependent oxidoreductase [Rhodothermales bacterium]|nr:SDR family NAD(P)-dependent oxidoreductase [Rhodothermales bacterium]